MRDVLQTVTLRVTGPPPPWWADKNETHWPLTRELIKETVENLNDLVPEGYLVDVASTTSFGWAVPCS